MDLPSYAIMVEDDFDYDYDRHVNTWPEAQAYVKHLIEVYRVQPERIWVYLKMTERPYL